MKKILLLTALILVILGVGVAAASAKSAKPRTVPSISTGARVVLPHDLTGCPRVICPRPTGIPLPTPTVR